MKPGIALLSTEQRPAISGAPDKDNRQWVHVAPAGIARPRDGRGPWRINDAQAVVSASMAFVGKAGMMVDYNHQSFYADKNGQPAPAAGWVVKLEARKNGIWALVEWTAKAAAHIRAREFRHLSPVLILWPDGVVRRIHNIALVNEPALDDLVALAQSELNMDADAEALAELQKLLGLTEKDGLAEVLAKVREMLTAVNSSRPDPAAFVPMAEFTKVVAEANKLRQGLSASEAVAHVENTIRAGRLIGAHRAWAIQLCQANKPAFDDFVAKTSEGLQRLLTPAIASAIPPSSADRARGGLADDEAAIARNLGLTPEQYSAARAGSNS